MDWLALDDEESVPDLKTGDEVVIGEVRIYLLV